MVKKLLYTLMCFFVLFFLLACGSTNHNKREIAAEQDIAAELEMAAERAAALESIEAEKEAARTLKSRIATMREEEKRLAEEEKRRAEEVRKLVEEEKEEERKKFEEEKQKRIAEALNKTPVTPAKSEFRYGLANGNYGGVRITKYLGTDLAIKIPEKIEGLPVTEISDSAFNRLVVKIVLPDTIREISFSGCTELREVTLGSSMTLISDKCFAECRNLKKL